MFWRHHHSRRRDWEIGAKTQQSRRGHAPSFTRAAWGERMARQCENVQQFHPLQFMIHLGFV